MHLRLKDRIRFAAIFFKSLGEGEDSVRVEVVRDEDDTYQMTVTTDHMNAGYDASMYR